MGKGSQPCPGRQAGLESLAARVSSSRAIVFIRGSLPCGERVHLSGAYVDGGQKEEAYLKRKIQIQQVFMVSLFQLSFVPILSTPLSLLPPFADLGHLF